MHHRRMRADWERNYLITHLARIWRESGHDVVESRGPRWWPRAGLIWNHLDVSVVPASYRWCLRLHRAPANARLVDIRKTSISTLRLRRGGGWTGPVIVKSNLNYRGRPEALIFGKKKTGGPVEDYPVYPSAADVPEPVWSDRRLVVEKFVGETFEGRHVLRMVFFLGDRHAGYRAEAAEPVVKVGRALKLERMDVPEELLDYQRKMGIDYGKVDYVLWEGRPVVIDVNRTIGFSARAAEEDLWLVRHLAGGWRASCRRGGAAGEHSRDQLPLP